MQPTGTYTHIHTYIRTYMSSSNGNSKLPYSIFNRLYNDWSSRINPSHYAPVAYDILVLPSPVPLPTFNTVHSVDPTYEQKRVDKNEHRSFETAITEGLERSSRLLDCIDQFDSEVALSYNEAEEDGGGRPDLEGGNESRTLRYLLKLDFFK